MFFGAGPVETAVTNHYLKWEPTPEQQMMVGFGSYGAVLDVLQDLVASSGPYLLGESFTALDVYLGSQIIWGIGFGTMEKRPASRTMSPGSPTGRLTARRRRSTRR
jgi:glutathione S-transferase